MTSRDLANALLNNITPTTTKLTSTSPFSAEAYGVDAVPFLAIAGIRSAAPHLRNLSLRRAWSLVSKAN